MKHYTRVVGFFTEVENWAPERRVWEFPNRTYVDVNNIGNPESSEEIVKSTPKTTEESICETCHINTESVKEEKTITKFFDEKYLDLDDYNCLAVITSHVFNAEGIQVEYTISRNRPDIFAFNSVVNRNTML